MRYRHVMGDFEMLIHVRKTARSLINEVIRDDCPGMASEMSYNLIMFSAPGLVLVLALFGLLGRQQDIIDQILYYAAQVLPVDAMGVLKELIKTVLQGSSGGLAILGLLGALWSALNVAGTIIKALRRAYNVNEEEVIKKLSLFQNYFLALIVVFSFGLALLVGSNLLIFGNLVIDYMTQWFGKPLTVIIQLVHWSIISSFMVVITAYIYRIVPGYPSSRVPWRKAFVGAILFVSMWLILSILFSVYVQYYATYNKVYGTLGAFIILMLWLYLASLAFLTGGELNSLQKN